jgi:tetratricopeptide (TPR) repeat protein
MKKSKKTTEIAPEPPRAAKPFPWTWVLIAASIAVAFVIYSPSLNGPFVYDDQYLPFRLGAYDSVPFKAWIAGVRPMLMASYWVNYQVSGLEPGSYHIVNVLLHALNAILLGFAVRKLAASDWLGGLTGALFLVHPLHTEAVSYVASRSENLTVFFFFSAFVVFLYRREREIGFGTAALVLTLFGAACLSKEYAVTLPVLLLLTDLYFNESGGAKANWRLYAPIVAIAAAGGVFVLNVLKASDTAGFGLKDLSASDYFFTQCRAIWVYVAKFILPVGLNIDHDFAISRGPFDHGAIFGLLALLGASAAAFYYRKQFPLASYGWFAFLLLLAPTSSFVPIRDVLVERRVYLPSLGLLLIVAEGARRLKFHRAVYLAPILLFAAMTYQRNQVWADPLALWRDAAENSPNKWRVQFQVADALYRGGECAQSAAAFEKTSKLDKPDYRVFINWANALDCAGQAPQAMERAQQAFALEKTAQAYALIGMLQAKQNQPQEALETLNRAIALDGRFDPAYFYRGNVHMLLNDPASAAADYQRALDINPRNEQAARGLSRANRR